MKTRYFPKDSVIETRDDGIEIGRYDVSAIVYQGKRSKPDWHYRFRDAERREAKIAEWLAGIESSKAYKAQRKAENKGKLSDHAAVAAAIRAEMKKHGIAGKVRSEIYSGGDSVNVNVEDLAPWTAKALKEFAGKFQMGHFNGMEDIYEYSNRDRDIPQVKFVFVNNSMSDAMRQRIWDYIRTDYRLDNCPELPELYDDARNERVTGADCWVQDVVYRAFTGVLGHFWQKPRVALMATTAPEKPTAPQKPTAPEKPTAPQKPTAPTLRLVQP